MKNNKPTTEQICDAFDMFRKIIEINLLGKSYNNPLNTADQEIHEISSINGPFKKMIDGLEIKKILESPELERLLKYFQDNQLQKNPDTMEIINNLIKYCPGQIDVTLW